MANLLVIGVRISWSIFKIYNALSALYFKIIIIWLIIQLVVFLTLIIPESLTKNAQLNFNYC